MAVYLDNSATTKPCPEAVAAVGRMMTESFGNPVPIHTVVKGLDPAKKYRCLMNGAVRSGASWMGAGLTPDRILKQYESLVIEFVRES